MDKFETAEKIYSKENWKKAPFVDNANRKPSGKFLARRLPWILSVWFGLAFLIAGLFQIDRILQKTWEQAANQFQWRILVSGEPLLIDEVGAYLRQMDGAREVFFQTPEETFSTLLNDKNIAQTVRELGPEFMPPTWVLYWEPDALIGQDVNELKRLISDRAGVTDVAFSGESYLHLLELRTIATKSRIILLALLWVGIGLGTIWMSRALFFSETKKLKLKTLMGTWVSLVTVWMLAGILMNMSVGGLSPWYALVGIVLATGYTLVSNRVILKEKN